jgi:hypothetical protein
MDVITKTVLIEATSERTDVANGSATAAFLAAGIGAFAMGLFVLLNEAGLFAAPVLYAPAGGLSGRSTLAVVVWLIAWGVLHSRWKDRAIAPRRVYVLTLILTGIGILATFPPTWALL